MTEIRPLALLTSARAAIGSIAILHVALFVFVVAQWPRQVENGVTGP